MRTEWSQLIREAKVLKRYRGRVRERLAILEYARTHSLCAAGLRFGLDRKTVREWRDRWRKLGVSGLIPRYPKTRPRKLPDRIIELIREARLGLGYGSTRTQLWLWRVHRQRIAQSTIQSVVRTLKLPPVRPVRKRRPKQLKLRIAKQTHHPRGAVPAPPPSRSSLPSPASLSFMPDRSDGRVTTPVRIPCIPRR